MSLPFDSEFQRKVVKLALEDDGFCGQALRHLRPEMFESEALSWAWRQVERERKENRTPTLLVLKDRLRDLPRQSQPHHNAMVQMIEADVLREDAFIRARLGEFVQRNLFVAAFADSRRLYNLGQVDQAIDLMRQEAQKAAQVTFDVPDRAWFFDTLRDRQRVRRTMREREWEFVFPTGIHVTDLVLDGGLSRGELGTWIADSKGGKSLFLVHLAMYASRAMGQRVLFIVLEGSRHQAENRLEALASGLLYREIKRGEIDPQRYEQLTEEYRSLTQNLVVRGMTDRWNYTAGDIRAELDDLKTIHGWRPVMLVCDYGDLLRSQSARVANEEQHQRDGFSDLKTLSTQDQGYAIWTASQARRPAKKQEEKDKESRVWGKPVLRSKDVADSYNKIRRSDFIGSINQDPEEKKRGEARLYHELYRDNAAHRVCKIKQDLDRMIFADLTDPLNHQGAQNDGDPDRPPELEL